MTIHCLRPRDHEDAARVAISWLAQRLRGPDGAVARHLRHEITDPMGHLAASRIGDTARAPQAPTAGSPELPPEVTTQAIEQFMHRHYATWCDESIPALGGPTPRQAIGTPAGLERVKGLLREHEDGERRQGAVQGRPAVSYQFLRDALGISR